MQVRGAAVLVLAVVLAGCGGDKSATSTSTTVAPTITVPPTTTTSVDPRTGLVWAQVPLDETVFANSRIWSVAEGGPGLVAVGADWSGNWSVGAVWVSEDGFIWERVPDDAGLFGTEVNAVVAGGSGLVAVGGPMWVSADGFAWSRIEDGALTDSLVTSVVAGGPGLVAGGIGMNGAVVWLSPDGHHWTRVEDDAPFAGDRSPGVFSITAGGPGLVAVGYDNWFGDGGSDAFVWVSEDGLDWTRVDGGDLFARAEMNAVTAGGPGLVAVGGNYDGAPVWLSADGYTWTSIPPDEKAFGSYSVMSSVVAGGPGLVAVGSVRDDDNEMHGAVWTSEDGYAWSRLDEATFGGFARSVVTWEQGLIIAGTVSDGNGTEAAIWMSPPPTGAMPTTTTSTTTTLPSTTGPVSTTTWPAVQNAGLLWARVPDPQAVFGTPGDVRWVTSVVAGGPGLVAAGTEGIRSGDRDGAVWLSADGRTWIIVEDDVLGGPGDQKINSVTAGGPGLVAAGIAMEKAPADGVVWVSADGHAWERIDDESVFGGEGAQMIEAVTAGGPGVVAVGSDSSGEREGCGGHWVSCGAVWVSPDGYAWTRLDNGSAFGQHWAEIITAVTAGGPGLVAVGYDTYRMAGDSNAYVWLSADGYDWTRIALGGEGSQSPEAVTVGGPGLVAVGAGADSSGYGVAAVWVSGDGYTWTRVSHDEAVFGGPGRQAVMDFVTAGGPGLVAVGHEMIEGESEDRRAVWVSADGYTWSRVTDEAVLGEGDMYSVIAWERGVAAVGRDAWGAAVWLSPPPG